MSNQLANVSLPIPFDRLFTYIIPAEMEEKAVPGTRVLVPFGKRYKIGYIVERPETTQLPALKQIQDVLDPYPIFTEEMLDLCKWIAEYYMAPLGEVLRSATPAGLMGESKRLIKLLTSPSNNTLEEWRKKAPRKAAIIHTLQSKGELSLAQLQKSTRFQNIYSVVTELERDEYIVIKDQLPRTKIKPKTEVCYSLNYDVYSRGEYLQELESLGEKAPRQRALLATLLERNADSPITERDLLKSSGASKSSLDSLIKKDLVKLDKRESGRGDLKEIESPEPLKLTGQQSKVLNIIEETVQSGKHHTMLLYGVTGSGKTQIYIEAIKMILKMNKDVIVLVPEISLTPQTVRRFKAHFGDDIAVFHSRLSMGERYDAWKKAKEGKASIVIGPRSAIFAPMKNIGLIVIDEEHETSYKQFDSMPRYNARDVAIMRGYVTKAVTLLGSATPSLETYTNALTDKYGLIELPERINTRALPPVHIVNMRDERKAGSGSISKLLREHIRMRLDAHEGIIILQNRRGFAPYLECLDCGYIEECTECSVTLTYHKSKNHLRCHYCGRIKSAPSVCPKCSGRRLIYRGFGTQRVEEELNVLFPGARTIRMDLDSTNRKGSHSRILAKFEEGEYDILLGTQMVAKGLDFDRVTLVGVISADTQLLLPDFRSAEKTFQLLTQVAGRSGRSIKEGEVVIQTNHPDHYSLIHAARHDFRAFYKEEMEKRRETDWPPYTRLTLLESRSQIENNASKVLSDFLLKIRGMLTTEYHLLGPAPAALARIKDLFRYHLIIKAPKRIDPTGKNVREAIRRSLPPRLPPETKLTIDVDPYGIL